MGWNSVRERIRELFLLERAQQVSATLSEEQRSVMRTYSEAAVCRLGVARDLRGTTQIPVALELYRQGGLFYARAFLASKDPALATLDATALPPDVALDKFDEALRAEGALAPREYGRVRPLLPAADPLAFDRMPSEQTELRAQDFDVATRWLSRLFDVRSPRDLRIARIVRIAAASISTLVLLVMFFSWLLAPKNLAKGRPATISGTTMFATVPEGAVDGSKSGQYGYHSALEESPWLAVDLGQRFALKSIKVYGRGDGYYDQSIPLALEVSDDGTTYKQIDQRTEPFSSDDPWVIKPANVVTQFIRLHTLRHSYLVLGEVEVFGRKAK